MKQIVIATDEDQALLSYEINAFADGLARALDGRAYRLPIANCSRIGDSDERPTGIIYIPSQSAMAHKCRHIKKLQRWYPDAHRVMVHVQPLRESDRPRWPVRLRCTDPVLVLSYRSLLALSRLGLKGDVIPAGVDLSAFHPAEDRVKALARSRLSVGSGVFVVLWDGGPNDADMMIQFRKQYAGAEVIAFHAVGPLPVSVASRLDAHGIRVFDPSAALVELVFAADALVCSRTEEDLVVEVPMTIPAGVAAGLPVLSRPVGGLRDFFEAGTDFLYWNTMEELLAAAQRTQQAANTLTRDIAEFTWERVARRVLDVLEGSTDNELAVPGR